MKGEISFDTEVLETGQDHVEGCYRIDGQGWEVFYFTHRRNGKWWQGEPVISKHATWRSGVTGVDALYPKDQLLNKNYVMGELSKIKNVDEWSEVRGPDSLQLK